MTVPLIIDTDVALGAVHDGRPRDIDDAFAIVEAMNTDAIDLIGITTVFGNAPLHRVEVIAREIAAMKASDVPVATGAAAPSPDTTDTTDTNEAVELMADLLAEHNAHIAAIGPLTNIGILAARYPERLANAKSVVIVGGRSLDRRFYLGAKGPVGDFNVESDIDAARALMEHGVPVVMAGFELTSQVTFTHAHLQAIAPSSIRDYFVERATPWLDYWTATFPADDGFHPWDCAAIDWITHAERYTSEVRGWRLRPSPDEPDKSWLETDASLVGDHTTFLTGFADGCAAAFVDGIVANIY